MRKAEFTLSRTELIEICDAHVWGTMRMGVIHTQMYIVGAIGVPMYIECVLHTNIRDTYTDVCDTHTNVCDTHTNVYWVCDTHTNVYKVCATHTNVCDTRTNVCDTRTNVCDTQTNVYVLSM